MNKPKLITALIAAVLVLIVLWQNTETVEARFLFFTIPLTSALLITALLGFTAGTIVTWSFLKKK